MKRLLILPVVLFWMISIHAQALSPEVVATAGTSFSSPTETLDFTIGEMMTSSFRDGSIILTQGFHQPEILFVSIEKPDPEISFSLFPNPTERMITIESAKEEMLQVRIYDSVGKTVATTAFFRKKITLDLQTLISGYYIMAISNASGKHLISYTFMKSNV
ncbi:MAG TPA: T9SS type A sorting domain-containing protein [Saprospiraceae bacterium]|nr:T9SS type A sorting domain-containing protein [Saprospiraceae bacterium]